MATQPREAIKGALEITEAETAFGETIRRVVDGREQVILTREGEAVAAIVPVEDLHLLRNLQRQRFQELAAAGRARRQKIEAGGAVPAKATMSEPEWQQRWDALLARIQSRVPEDITLEEIEADISEGREEIRKERRARRR